MRMRALGQLAIVYSKDGDLYYILGQSTFLTQPDRITCTPDAVESHPVSRWT